MCSEVPFMELITSTQEGVTAAPVREVLRLALEKESPGHFLLTEQGQQSWSTFEIVLVTKLENGSSTYEITVGNFNFTLNVDWKLIESEAGKVTDDISI